MGIAGALSGGGRKVGSIYWGDHKNWKMFPVARLQREAEGGWELVGAFSVILKGRQEIHFILKRGVLL